VPIPRRTLLAGSLAAAGAAFTGCGPGAGTGPSASSTGRQTQLTWLASPITQNQNDAPIVLRDAFEMAYPAMTVNLVNGPVSTDTLRKTLTMDLSSYTNGEPIELDLFLGDVIWPAEFGAHGYALALNRHLPADFWRRFAPGLVEGTTYKGNRFAAPLFTDQGILYYRRDLLERVGRPAPETWADVVDTSRALMQRKLPHSFVWQGAAYEGLTCNWLEYLTDAGGRILDAAGSHSQINSPEARNALNFMVALVKQGVSPSDVARYQELESMAAFRSGDAAFLRAWSTSYVNVTAPGVSIPPGQVGVAPMPTFGDRSRPGYSTAGGWSLYANPRSPNLPGAMTFINWMTSRSAQDILAGQYSLSPANQAVRVGTAAARADDSPLAVASRARLVSRPSYTPYYEQVSLAVYTALNNVLLGSIPPDKALEQADGQINRAISGGKTTRKG
jgi:multiple sugar transport system substrate-binding protein